MKKTYLILGGIGVVGIGYALYRYFSTQAKLLSDYEYTIIGFSVKKISLNEISLDIKVRFISKSDIEATVQQIYLDVYAEGASVGFVSQDQPFLIPAKGSSDIMLHMTFNPQLVLKNVVTILLQSVSKKDVNFTIKGYAKIKSGFVTATIPITYADKISSYI